MTPLRNFFREGASFIVIMFFSPFEKCAKDAVAEGLDGLVLRALCGSGLFLCFFCETGFLLCLFFREERCFLGLFLGNPRVFLRLLGFGGDALAGGSFCIHIIWDVFFGWNRLSAF